MNNTLHLILNKKWFDQIISGVKTEEFREIKPFWEKRISKPFDKILFQNGYSKDARKMLVDCCGIEKRKIKHEHFGETEIEVFALKLGQIRQIADDGISTRR